MPKRGALSKRIARIYVENMYTRMSRWGKPAIEETIARLSKEQEIYFRQAAHQCAALKADPLEYVAAQFSVFDVASRRSGRNLLPKPCHLKGPGALARWETRESRKEVESCADAISRVRRSVPGSEGDVFDPDLQRREFFREARKLENLVQMTMLPERVILQKFPNEFTPAFVASRAA